MKDKLYTIGHSTHTIAEFIAILQHYSIKQLIDIRTIPYSNYNPQFNAERLKKSLAKAHIKYTHIKGLGGLRHPKKDSINTAWHNASFRGFADYMQTDAFEKNLERLLKTLRKKPTCIMCAEAVPWRCHRSLIGDALLAKKVKVIDIYSLDQCKPHRRTPWSKRRKGKIIYPALPSA